MSLNVDVRGHEKTYIARFVINKVVVKVSYWWGYTDYGEWRFNLVVSGNFLKRDLCSRSGSRSSIYKMLCELKLYSPQLMLGFDVWSIGVLDMLFDVIGHEYAAGCKVKPMANDMVAF